MLTGGLTGYLLTAGAGLLMLLFAYMKGGLDTAKKEAAKRAAEELKARDLADDIQNDVGALPPDAARRELKEW